MRVLQIGADRSKRGIHAPGSSAYARQKAYAEKFGALDIVGFTRSSDVFAEVSDGSLRIFPTNSLSRFLYVIDAILLASRLPWPDVVSAQDPFETGLAALAVSRFTKKPLHVQVHTDFLSPAYARLSFANRIRVLIARIVLGRATRVRVVSERIKRSILEKYRLSCPVTVLPIYVDVERVRRAKPGTELTKKFAGYSKRLLYVGRLEKEKHPCLALRAFADAAPKDACLIVVGTGSERAYLEQLARGLGISDRVFFEGEKDSASYYHITDLVLVTSRYEGYGLVIVEALAAGKPVLSTDVGIAREAGAIVANDSGYVDALRRWFIDGLRTALLTNYPYNSLNDYVAQYSQDVASTGMR